MKKEEGKEGGGSVSDMQRNQSQNNRFPNWWWTNLSRISCRNKEFGESIFEDSILCWRRGQSEEGGGEETLAV
jgi:hypothetical protein